MGSSRLGVPVNGEWECKKMRKITQLLVASGFVAAAGGAGAVQYTWDFANGAVTSATHTACGGNTALCQVGLTININGNNRTMLARAYSTDNAVPSLSGNLIGADIVRYAGSGLGVRNLDEGASEGTSPEHSLDNQDRFDVIVFEAPTDNFSWDSMLLGWAREQNGSGGYVNQADVQFYVGGAGAGKDFTTMCFTGCGVASNNIQDGSSGFASLGVFSNVAQGTSADLPAGTKGRYLVVSGALSGEGLEKKDYFKIGNVVPVPQTIALVGIGVLAMLMFSRRKVASF